MFHLQQLMQRLLKRCDECVAKSNYSISCIDSCFIKKRNNNVKIVYNIFFKSLLNLKHPCTYTKLNVQKEIKYY